MALTISGDGTSQAVYLRQNVGVIEYSVGATPGSYTSISNGQWPVTINNTPTPGPSSILRVVATTNLTFTSSYGNTNGYLITGSEYITFDGSANTITIDGITNYPGFIQNGIDGVNGQANVVVQNFITGVSGTSTLNIFAGWLCQPRFGNGVSGISIIGCTNYGDISATFGGGITGFALALNGGSATITNCTNNGTISGDDAGGIVGATSGSAGSVTITNCTNNGAISGYDVGGIAGSYAGANDGVITIINCFSTGSISGQYAGGITGYAFAYNTTRNCVISGCYSTGDISGDNAGGIVGSDVGNNNNALYNAVVDISNCYSLGAIANTTGGICGGNTGTTYTNKSTINITNSYSFGAISGTGQGLVAATLTSTNIILTASNTYVAAGTWRDASANAGLTGVPTGVGISNKGTTWTSISTGTPYLLSSYWSITNPTQIYTPNSVSSSTNYTSSAGAYSPGIYSIQSSSQVGTTITVNVAAVAGTSPIYYRYYNNIYTFTNTSDVLGAITASINQSTGVLGFNLPKPPPYPCFLEGTKILCFENDQEVYRPIESLRKGDLVKTIYKGYLPIYMIGTTAMYNPGNDYRVTNRLYKCSREKYPALFEDLYITGCHSILVPSMTDDQWENTKAVNGKIHITDNHFRLIACADEKAEPFNKEGSMNIYHIALENDNYYMNYGIYANGLLVESCSKRYLTELSNMRILGEADSAISEDSGKVLNNMTRQLIETY